MQPIIFPEVSTCNNPVVKLGIAEAMSHLDSNGLASVYYNQRGLQVSHNTEQNKTMYCRSSIRPRQQWCYIYV